MGIDANINIKKDIDNNEYSISDTNNDKDDAEKAKKKNNEKLIFYTMKNDSEYHEKMIKRLNIDKVQYDQYHDFGFQEDWDKYLNPEGFGLIDSDPNQINNFSQQNPMVHESWKSLIDAIAQKGISTDLADIDNMNNPLENMFSLFPFHNKNFVFQNGKFYIKQNDTLFPIADGENPFQLIPSSPKLKERQSFNTKLL